MPGHRIFTTSLASIHPHYVAKAERKGRTRAEVDTVICWLTGHEASLQRVLDDGTDLETFFARAPAMNPDATLITGVICGHRVEDIQDPLMQQIRWMDKLVDEVARGKKMSSIFRSSGTVRDTVRDAAPTATVAP
ncbi:DUF2200 domain-containing protein [Cellulomonas marina]|uniref:DUF2200 domain-containing protein n=1 Tax=Cellulomonas marina TaxID=988821 RepID=A0A1I0XLE3_9CELL|nr:DUF2200 domain-containing protein [Cellulomonas marina]GIG30091.1 hypothetical protein Cma02nite_26910 [Cellulomonas marina]SFB01028.1 hypothetical protein SAMN05421867_10595 [Cellulomonas marina]